MPETQKEKYDSCEPMTTGQFKQIGALLLALVSSDLTKGFADELIEGRLHKQVSGILAEERRRWRLLHSRMGEIASFLIPPTPVKSLREFMRGLSCTTPAGNRFWYQGANGQYSVFEECYTAQPSLVTMCYRTSGEVDFNRLIEAVGSDAFLRNSLPTLTPLQVLFMLDWKGEQKEKWKDAEFSCLLGRTHDGKFLFLEGRPGMLDDKRCWKLNEWTLEKGGSIRAGVYLVFSRSLFE